MIDEKRTIIVRDAELHWAKLVRPVEPFGTLQWELQMRTRDKGVAEGWKKDFYLTVKPEEDDDGTYYKTNVKRKAIKKDGDQNSAPEVLDGNKKPIDGNVVGNGSVGNVMLFQYPYEMAGRKGVSSILSKVQVTELKEYKPTTETDFDIIEGGEAGTDNAVDF